MRTAVASAQGGSSFSAFQNQNVETIFEQSTLDHYMSEESDTLLGFGTGSSFQVETGAVAAPLGIGLQVLFGPIIKGDIDSSTAAVMSETEVTPGKKERKGGGTCEHADPRLNYAGNSLRWDADKAVGRGGSLLTSPAGIGLMNAQLQHSLKNGKGWVTLGDAAKSAGAAFVISGLLHGWAGSQGTLDGCGTYKEVTKDLGHTLDFTFTYQTSPSANNAGPAHDAFLVPAVFFEVRRVWFVRFSEDECVIAGRMDTTLKANVDLSGFSFTTANDIETRTLPLLKEQSKVVDLRLDCDAKQTVAACCDDEDIQAGCSSSTLAAHCDFKHGKDHTLQQWADCYSTPERFSKSKCKEHGSGECSFKGIEAQDLKEYCTLSPEPTEQCMLFEDPRLISRAHGDWYNILDRNYRHHEKARLQKQRGGKTTPVYYNTHDYQSVRYGPLRAGVPVLPLRQLAPILLMNTVKDSGGEAFKGWKKFLDWNTIGYDGGGSVMEYTTNEFRGKDGKRTLKDHFLYTEVDKSREGSSANSGIKSKTKIGGLAMGTKISLMYDTKTSHRKTVSKAVVAQTTLKGSHQALFHLQDPNAGDYFLLSVYSDPDYGTPLFSLGELKCCVPATCVCPCRLCSHVHFSSPSD